MQFRKRGTIIAYLLSMVLLFASLTACGGDSNGDSNGDSSSSSSNIENSETPTPASNEITVTEQVLFEQSGIKLTLKGLKNGILGPELTVLVENDGSLPVTVQTRDVSVNGFMMNSVLFSADVVAGKKNNSSITFMSIELEENGIETIETIELFFHVFNSESWDTVFDTDTFVINTSAAGSV
jgi:hypothetical protein